jgi:hypothetical protein
MTLLHLFFRKSRSSTISLTLSVLIAAALLARAGDDLSKNSNSSKGSDTSKPVISPAVELVERPNREGFTYFISEGILFGVSKVTGVVFPGEWWAANLDHPLDIQEDTSRQFRLRDGRHVLVIYDAFYCYSVIFIYKIPVEKGKSTKVDVDTKDGSAEVWLMRHEGGHAHADHFLPLDRWKQFLALSKNERTKQSNVFELNGTMKKVTEDEYGVVSGIEKVDLRSAEPLPPHLDFVDSVRAINKNDYEHAVSTQGDASGKLKEKYDRECKLFDELRKSKCKEVAEVKGNIIAGWQTDKPKISLP